MYEDDDWDQLIGGIANEEAEFNRVREQIMSIDGEQIDLDPEISKLIDENLSNLVEENPYLSDKTIAIVAKRLEEQIDKDIVDNIIGVLPDKN